MPELRCTACGESAPVTPRELVAGWRCPDCRDPKGVAMVPPVSHVQPSAVLPVLRRAVTVPSIPSAPQVQNEGRC